MKRVLIAGLIAISAVGTAQASDAGAFILGAVVTSVLTQPRVIYAPQPQVIYQPQPQVIYQQPEYRTMPQYTPQYQPPYVSCTPAYTQYGQYLGCIR